MQELVREKVGPWTIRPGDKVEASCQFVDFETNQVLAESNKIVNWTAPEDFSPQVVDEIVIFSINDDDIWEFAIGGMVGRRRQS